MGAERLWFGPLEKLQRNTMIGEPLRSRAPGNARFPHGPSGFAFALILCGSILVTTGPALRDLAGR